MCRSTLIAGAVALALLGAAAGAVFVLQSDDVNAPRAAPPIAFASDRDGHDAVYVVDPDGTHLRHLIANASEPRWSPDGSHIAFRRGDDEELFVADARGHVIGRLVASYGAYAWAPDGSRIVSEAEGGLVVVRLDGRRTRVTRGSDSSPSWSPDGKLVAFVREQSGGSTLLVTDGRTERKLAKGANLPPPAWSPDGTQLAYVRSSRPVLIDVVTLEQRPLADLRFDEYDVDDVTLAWSPDGSRIALGPPGDVVVVRVAGGRRQVIPHAWYAPSWSPDGRSLASSDETDVLLASVGGRAKLLTKARRYGYSNTAPDWYPRPNGAAVGGQAVSAKVPTDSRQVGLVLEARNAVDFIAADGPRVAIAYASSPNCIELWTPSTRRLVRFAEAACSVTAEGGEAMGIAGLALAGRRLAWTIWMETNHYTTWVVAATELRPAPASVFEAEDVVYAGTPVGEGALLVFESWRDDRRGAIRRIDGKRLAVVARTTGAPALLAVGGGLVVRRRDRTAIDVLRANGTPVASFRAAARITAAAVDHGVVAVQSGRTLATYDVRTRRPVATRAIGAGERLVDLDGGIALLVAGRELRLLRLSDGADTTIHVPGGARVNAQLEPAGLYYSFAARVAFVPRGVLLRRLPG